MGYISKECANFTLKSSSDVIVWSTLILASFGIGL